MKYHQEVPNKLNYKALGTAQIFLILHLPVKTSRFKSPLSHCKYRIIKKEDGEVQ